MGDLLHAPHNHKPLPDFVDTAPAKQGRHWFSELDIPAAALTSDEHEALIAAQTELHAQQALDREIGDFITSLPALASTEQQHATLMADTRDMRHTQCAVASIEKLRGNVEPLYVFDILEALQQLAERMANTCHCEHTLGIKQSIEDAIEYASEWLLVDPNDDEPRHTRQHSRDVRADARGG
jgi:hypothetical protein